MAKTRVRMTQQALMPEGKYAGHILDVTFNEAKSADKFPYLTFKFAPEEDEHADERVRGIFSFHPKAAWALQAALDALDISYEVETDDDDNQCIVFDTDDLEGCSCVAEIGHNTYNNRTNAQVQRVYAPLE